MATYYVQPNGSNANTGLGASNATAWQTVQKALGATGIGSGDTLYIAPGTYREAITIGGTYSATTTIIGDRTASQFTGISAGYVRITGLVSDALNASTSLGDFTINGKSYLTFDSLWLEHKTLLPASTSNINFIRCQITTPFQIGNNVGTYLLRITTTGQSAILFDKCYIQGGIGIEGTGTTTTTRFNACLIECATSFSGAIEFSNSGAPAVNFTNCTIFGSANGNVFRCGGTVPSTAFIYNCLIVPDVYVTSTFFASAASNLTEDYNAGYITRTTTPAGANTKQVYHRAFTHTPIYINPVDASIIPFTPLAVDSLIGAGSATYSFGTDYFGNAWANPPSIGAMELKTYSTIGAYNPTDRNASTITIAPGSTSQSIELYLGATGLTSSTSGLSAYYNRTRTASVSIPLVARTIAQAWTSGGFAEVDATNMPGVYRLDLPDAALIAGADDVTIVVRGASGTNGAVMTVTLINEPTDAVLVRMGPFEVKADGLGASDPLDIQKGAQHGVDIQCVDAFGSGIDITSATVTAKVYNSGATLVDTYSCTATYAADGRATFTIDTTVTNTPGTYTATITRTTSASDTQIFGPLRIYVRDI